MHEEQGRCYIHDQTASQHIYSVWETTQLMMYKAQGSDLVLTQTSKCTVDSGVYTAGEVHLSLAMD